MLIKVAVLALGAICVSAPVIQTIRYSRFRQGSPWRIPLGPSMEGIGWMLVALALGALLVEGALFLAWPGVYDRIPAPVVPDSLRILGLGVGVFGCWFAFRAQSAMGASWRVGTDPHGKRDLVTEGVFNHIRNPIYLGFLLQIFGGAILLPTALSATVAIVALVGMHLIVASEERFLEQTYGDAYLAYKERTGRFLPRPARGGGPGKLST